MEDPVRVRFTELFNQSPELEYGEIAATLNEEFRQYSLRLTRSAVSGMARRAGFSRRKAGSGGRKPRRHHKPRSAPVNSAPLAAKGTSPHTLAARAEAKRLAAVLAAQLAAEYGALAGVDNGAFDGSKVQGLRNMAELNSTACRWPFDCSDGLVRYCPNTKPDSVSVPYCGPHTRAATR